MEVSSLECVVCFETMSHQIDLPCACNVSYCARCWDRSLAQSFFSVGQARCPTCRSSVGVEFDAENACLVFSPAAPSPDGKNPDSEQALDLIRRQARPLQIRLLNQHRTKNPMLGQICADPYKHMSKLPVSQ